MKRVLLIWLSVPIAWLLGQALFNSLILPSGFAEEASPTFDAFSRGGGAVLIPSLLLIVLLSMSPLRQHSRFLFAAMISFLVFCFFFSMLAIGSIPELQLNLHLPAWFGEISENLAAVFLNLWIYSLPIALIVWHLYRRDNKRRDADSGPLM